MERSSSKNSSLVVKLLLLASSVTAGAVVFALVSKPTKSLIVTPPAKTTVDDLEVEMQGLRRTIAAMASAMAARELRAPVNQQDSRVPETEPSVVNLPQTPTFEETYKSSQASPRLTQGLSNLLRQKLSEKLLPPDLVVDEVDCHGSVCMVRVSFAPETIKELVVAQLAGLLPDSSATFDFSSTGGKPSLVMYQSQTQ